MLSATVSLHLHLMAMLPPLNMISYCHPCQQPPQPKNTFLTTTPRNLTRGNVTSHSPCLPNLRIDSVHAHLSTPFHTHFMRERGRPRGRAICWDSHDWVIFMSDGELACSVYGREKPRGKRKIRFSWARVGRRSRVRRFLTCSTLIHLRRRRWFIAVVRSDPSNNPFYHPRPIASRWWGFTYQ